MKAKEILASLSGVSIPIFGIQWQPAMPDITTARHLIRELENRRVLYREYESEGTQYCVSSVDQIRSVLTSALKNADEGSELYKRLQKMRAASRKFCDAVQASAVVSSSQAVQRSVLHRELIKLRQVVGLCVGELAIGYGLDVHDELALIIPFNPHP
jgi:hypothetical protein